ncbi:MULTISPECIES: hypothetical protein [Pedobacter]|uniref:hypothetical protein n=1 Tax=Pedobacter TaxID=84567 RepID=UPI000B4BE2CF|nr:MULTISPECIES: hypothetical protein [Pedobacter]OWK70323.1 hypothetical protein CBW18_12745 [Pedobacter sp. AJM]
MGTTQRIIPGVPHQPNWGALNNAITRVANAVEEDQREDEDADNVQDDGEAQRRLIDRRDNNLRGALKNLVKTGGGSADISKGRSTSIGKAGLRTAGKFLSVFTDVAERGLEQVLTELEIEIAGMSVESVIDFLLIYCSSGDAGMDETAANKAFAEVTEHIIAQTGNDLKAFEDYIKQAAAGEGLTDLLCVFWGYYIYEHLAQRFQEKITQLKGEQVSFETFQVIKDDILGQVKLLGQDKKLSAVDWRGEEGKTFIEQTFESILKIIAHEN